VDELAQALRFREDLLERKRRMKEEIRKREEWLRWGLGTKKSRGSWMREINGYRSEIRHLHAQLRFVNRVIREIQGAPEHYELLDGWQLHR
jgi:hypothetical protein